MAERSVLVRLRADIEGYRRGMNESSELARRQSDAMGKVGKGAAAMGAAMAAGLVVASKAAIEWESAWAGVTKTVDGSVEQMAALEEELRGLATTLPSTHTEIAAVAEAAGQLGVKREDIAAFTKTMIDLGETTNLTADEAATSMAKLANIMGTAGGDIDRLGATLVALGNDGASTEADIVQMAVRIAGAGKQIGLTEGEVLGFANALSSVGIEAEAGGSSISRVMIDIATAVETGGGSLETFAEVAGVTTTEFSAAFGQDAAGAVNLFIDGLGQMSASGESTFGVLEELGLSEIRVRDALLRLSNAQGLATESTQLGNQAWKDNTALVDEANKRYETTESRLKVARNSLNELAIDLGTVLLPAIGGAAEGLADLAGFLSDLPGPVQTVLVLLSTLAATIGLLGGGALWVIPKLAGLHAALVGVGISAGAATTAVSTLTTVLKAAGLLLAAAAIVTGVYMIGRSMQKETPNAEAFTDSLRKFGDTGKLTGAVAADLGANFEKLAGKLEVANNNKLSIIDGAGLNEVESARDLITGLDESLAALVDNGRGAEAKALFTEMATAVEAEGGSVEELNGKLTGYYDALAAADRAQKDATSSAYEAADAVGSLAVPLGTAYDSLGAYAESLQLGEDATADMVKQVEEWATSLADFVQPLGAYTDLIASKTEAEQKAAEATATAQNDSVDAQIKAVGREYDARLTAMRANEGISAEAIQAVEDQRDSQVDALESQKKGWEDYADAVSVSVTEYLGELERQVEVQEAHADNMLMLAGRVSQGTLDELARMGPEGAPLVAELVNASDAELGKLDDLFRRRTSDATGAMAGELYLANVLLPQIAAKVGEDTAIALATALANGTTTVAQIAQDYAHVLAGGINPILTAIGRHPVAGRGGRAGGLSEFADGGLEDHTAQIAPAGAMRLWAEPETGGEAYIPLAQSKRARSLAIWQETGRRLQAFARGGFAGPGDVPGPPSTAPFGAPVSTAADRGMGLLYGEATEFVRANAAPVLGPGIGWQAMMAALRTRFPNLPLNSGFRPGSITATGNPSYHGMGRAVDIPPRMDVNKWIAENYRAQTRELIFSAPGATQLRNGAPHVYTGITKAMHYDHNHWAMAKGGILNPHVRDAGGPLLPGHTFNGTGRPEMVLPMAAGGVIGGRQRQRRAAGPSFSSPGFDLSDAAAGLSLSEVNALVAAYGRYNDELEQAARRHELMLTLAQASADVEFARSATVSIEDRTRAAERYADALKAVQEFDTAAARQSETAAVEQMVDALEAAADAERRLAEAGADAAASRREREDNRFDLGFLSDDKYLAVLTERMAAERKFSDEWTSIYRQREAVLADQAAAERELTDAAAQTLTEQQRAQQTSLDLLTGLLDQEANVRGRAEQSTAAFHAAQLARQDSYVQDSAAALGRLLDQEVDVRGRLAASASAHVKAVTAVQAQQVSTEAEFYTQSATLTEDYQQGRARAEADFATRSVQAGRSYAAAQAQILAQQSQTLRARRDELFAWADLSTVAESRWGNSAAQLIGNARAQAEQFADWMAELATARGRGLSEEVIGALGLDDGPQSLAQLRQLNGATVTEIADLNAEVARRTALAGTQVRDEQSRGFASVAAEMAAAQEAYNAEMAELTTAHGLSQAEALAGYTTAAEALQAAYLTDQQALGAQLSEMQAVFVEEQHALTVELSLIGIDQGRSHTDALAAALASGLPGVQAAADQLTHALGGGLNEEMRAAHVDFLAEQEALVTELGLIGVDQGRSYADSMAAGIASGIPGIAAAAEAARAATISLVAAQTALAQQQAAPSTGSASGGSLVQGPPPPGGWTRQQQAVIDMGGIIRTGAQLGQLHLGSYDGGGWLEPGYTLAYNGLGARERVFTPQQMQQQAAPGPISVTVLLGDREIRDIVGVEVNGKLTQHRTVAAVAGARG